MTTYQDAILRKNRKENSQGELHKNSENSATSGYTDKNNLVEAGVEAEDGIRYQPRSRGLGDVYKRQKLNGYGEHIFNDVPVVITQFTIDLPQDVDYISMGLPKTASDQSQTGNTASDKRNFVGWAPSQSLITVTVQPVYSRRDIAQFSLKKYVNGGYLGDGGFI